MGLREWFRAFAAPPVYRYDTSPDSLRALSDAQLEAIIGSPDAYDAGSRAAAERELGARKGRALFNKVGLGAETLAEGLGHILEEGAFQPVSSKTADDAVTVLFDRALMATPSLSIDAVRSNYEMLRGPWSSQTLFEGSRDRTYSIVVANLRRIQSTPDFRRFEISVDLTKCAAQISATVGRYVIPVSVWRSGEIYLACGNSDFRG
jgi:hypothetical protein